MHLWVEQSFEFFAAAISAYLLMALGLVSRRLAERSVYLELILIFLGGVLGTGHHLYWAGEPGMWVPLGTMFSFIEVLPLVLLVIEAIQHHRLIKAAGEFKYGLAYLYIIGAAFWNFVGAGVFGGGTLNAPLVNYYEHAHLPHAQPCPYRALRRLRAAGDRPDLLLPALRRRGASSPSARGSGAGHSGCTTAASVLWIVLNFFPIGWPQLAAVYEHGLAYARSQAFYDTTLVLAVDADARRHRLRGGRIAHDLGFPGEAAPARPPPRAAAGAVPRRLPGTAARADALKGDSADTARAQVSAPPGSSGTALLGVRPAVRGR